MEEIDVPSHFLCPISLQIMRDPVTICSGITYDRESIEKWLFWRKQHICPVTKKPFYDSDLTPNHTLRRLIQAWCTLNAPRGVEQIPTPKPHIDRKYILKILNEAKNFPDSQLKCLRTLKSLAFQCERNKTYLQDVEALDFLVSMLKKHDKTSVEEALEVISNVISSKTLLKQLMRNNTEISENLVLVLKGESFQSRAYAVNLLKSIFKEADQTHKTRVKDDIFSELVRAINDQISTKSAIKILLILCPWGRNRIKAVKNGAVFALVELLNSSAGSESEAALMVLDQLCDCAEGRAEFLEHGAGLAILSRKILRVSHLGNDKAVRIVYSICKHSPTSRVLHEMLQVGMVPKLCLMLQVGASSKTKDRVQEILQLHPCLWMNSKWIPATLSSS